MKTVDNHRECHCGGERNDKDSVAVLNLFVQYL